MPSDYEQLKMRVQELEAFISTLRNVSAIDPQILRALSASFATSSSKGATSENVTIDEAGVATKTALGAPDGFLRVGDLNIPYYN